MTTLAKLVDYDTSSILGSNLNKLGGGLADKVSQGTAIGGQKLFTTTDDNLINIPDRNKSSGIVPLGTGIIDIVSNFEWNANWNGRSLKKIPKVYLIEREQQDSAMLAIYYYYISNIFSTLSNSSLNLSTGAAVEVIMTKVQEFASRAAKWGSDTINSATGGQGLQKFDAVGIEHFVKFLTNVVSDFNTLAANDISILGEYLKSYTGIYLTRETGFKYVFPYFDNQFMNVQNTWTNDAETSSAILDGADVIIEAMTEYTSPGVYIERPKYFSFEQIRGETIKIRFPLLNTVSNSYKKNYEFLWILGFQNRYYRQGFASVRPPKIYTLQLPGVKYMPYAYIENLSVDFLGTRRLMKVDTPMGEVEAPIPDAYMVEITVKSLLSDSANTMLSDQFYKGITTGIVNTRS